MAIKLEDIEIFSNSLGNNFGGGGAFGGASSGGGTNLTGIPNADYLQNLANLLQQQQQGPQLGPDEFGSYSIPASDPTYRSGFDYARSIAGGMPMSQVIAPGVSYSPEQPMGYTQEQLNTAVGTTPVGTPSPYGVFADDPSYFGTGIGGVNIPVDRKQDLPPRDIFSGVKDIRDTRGQKERGEVTQRYVPGGGGIDYGGTGFFDDLLSLGIDIPPLAKRPMISGLENRDFMDADSLITGVPTGRDFSIDREPIPPQDFGYGPGIMPPLPPMDIDKLIPPTDLPPINISSRIPLDLPPMVDLPPIRGIGKSNLNRFSIEQLPMGLFV